MATTYPLSKSYSVYSDSLNNSKPEKNNKKPFLFDFKKQISPS